MATQVPRSINTSFRDLVNWDGTILRRLERNDSKVKSIYLFANTVNQPNATFRQFSDAAGYAVPAGKQLLVLGAQGRSSFSAAGSVKLQGGSTDVGFSSASAASNLDLGATGGFRIEFQSGAGGGAIKKSVFLRITEGRYVQIFVGTSGSWSIQVTLECYLIDPSIVDLSETA